MNMWGNRSIAVASGMVVIVSSGLAVQGSGGTKITLDDALQMARKNNGTIQAARLDVKSARERLLVTYASFFPTITPSFIYNDTRREIADNQFGNQRLAFVQNSTQVQANYTIIDSGARSYNYTASRKQWRAQEFQALQTIRQTLFSVHQSFLETLRAQELQKVADSQVERARTVLAQTEARVEVGDAAKRDILQAKADELNAKVSAITAKNRIATNLATLKAAIGWADSETNPALDMPTNPEPMTMRGDLATVMAKALKERPDLNAQRQRVGQQEETMRLAETEVGIVYSLSFNYSLQVTPESLANQTLAFNARYPLFDGGRVKAQLRERRASWKSAQESLAQSERDAKAEVEQAFVTFEQNKSRMEAAKLAVSAARLNYDAAVESQKLGASNLIDVLTAQVSLVTSETNYIEALYDTLISELRLKLATGQPIPGE